MPRVVLLSQAMETLVAGSIAVAGTLLGSVVTYIFQRRSAALEADAAEAVRTRQELLNAFVEFAQVATELRRAQHDRWRRRAEDPESEAHLVAKGEYYRLRAAVLTAQLRLRLLLNDPDLLRLSDEVIELTKRMNRAADEEAVDQQGTQAQEALDQFIMAAYRRLRSPNESTPRTA